MSMKKIIAGVATAALTVSSLAVVGVSADTTKTFNFLGKDGSMDISYSKTVAFRGGIDRDDLFDLGEEYEFSYGLDFKLKDGYNKENESNVANFLKTVKAGNGSSITVTGTNAAGRTVTAKATAKVIKEDGKPVKEMFRTRYEGDEAEFGYILEDFDIDLTNFETVTSVAISDNFGTVATGSYYVREGTAKIPVTNTLRLADPRAIFDGEATYKSESKDNDGKVISTNGIYTFEGTEGTKTLVVDSQNAWQAREQYGISLGNNLLRWVNDNIEQNKGAKLRITFMKPDELKDAITSSGIDSYPTLPYDWAQWGGNIVLDPVTTTNTQVADIAIGVNLQNTSKLQQYATIKDYVAEFDWDTLVQNSTSTVSGNVDSIAIRVKNTDNVKNMITDGVLRSYTGSAWGTGDLNGGSDNGYYLIAIKQIDIVIPDQTAAKPNEAPMSVTAGSADCNVKVTGTYSTIYGNGAQDLAVTNDITNNSVSYSLKLTAADGSYVQPAGELTLQLSIPSDFKGRTLNAKTVKHTCNDGTVEDLPIQNWDTYKNDGYVVVKTSKFSSFEFGFEEEAETTTEAPADTTTEAPVETTTEAPVETTAPVADTNNGGADKNAPTGVVLAVVPAAIAAAAVVISKKRK